MSQCHNLPKKILNLDGYFAVLGHTDFSYSTKENREKKYIRLYLVNTDQYNSLVMNCNILREIAIVQEDCKTRCRETPLVAMARQALRFV